MPGGSPPTPAMTDVADTDLEPIEAGSGHRAADVWLIETDAELDSVAARCARAEILALDVEADGLFVYRPKTCAMQLAWREDGRVVTVVIDTLKVHVARLAGLLGPAGPVKVLHDLTFDARLLEESGAPLANVRDTSVAARLLGINATGLGALLTSELGITLPKRFQQHDWAQRPLAPEHLDYLVGDVLHLLDLESLLGARIAALGLEPEWAEECAYKLATAQRPPRDPRPAYARIKGASELDAQGRAALRRLVETREAAAVAADVPPFKIIGPDVLLEIARRRPRTVAELHQVRGAASGRAARLTGAWLAAITKGARDGEIPATDRSHFEPPKRDRAAQTLRRAREAQISAWRRAVALARGVVDQAVLPGHCAQELLEVILAAPDDDEALRAQIAAIPGLGAKRFELYGQAFVALARSPVPASAARREA